MENERTTITVFVDTKKRLDGLKLCSDETYDNELNRLFDDISRVKGV
jgi:hypothetical protein